MTDAEFALRYARALYETALELQLVDEVADDMEVLSLILQEVPRVREYCARTHNNRADERSFVRHAFLPYLGNLSGRTLETAIQHGRITIIPFLPQAFGKITSSANQVLTVTVEAAHEPEPAILEEIKNRMHQRSDCRIKIQVKVEPELIGGMRITWDSRLLDLSVTGRLKEMRGWIKLK